jgi:hypothetical protein
VEDVAVEFEGAAVEFEEGVAVEFEEGVAVEFEEGIVVEFEEGVAVEEDTAVDEVVAVEDLVVDAGEDVAPAALETA